MSVNEEEAHDRTMRLRTHVRPVSFGRGKETIRLR